MKKQILIEFITENKKECVKFTSENVNNFEIIGALTYYRDQRVIEVLNKSLKRE
jgi:hypothetical protein